MRACALLLAALCAGAALQGAPTRDEREVKAAFLYNFAKFVEWPWPLPEMESGESPFVVGVWQGGAYETELQRSLAGKRVHNRTIVVKTVRDVESAKRSDLLFFPSTGSEPLPVVLALAGNPTLTVGEGRGFAEQGGMIGFAMENKRVRFNINADSAAAAGLRISSQLLKLAKNLEGSPPAP